MLYYSIILLHYNNGKFIGIKTSYGLTWLNDRAVIGIGGVHGVAHDGWHGQGQE